MPDLPKRGGTRLGHIRVNHLNIECHCGHCGGIPVARLIDRYGPDMTVAEVLGRLPCSKCGAKRVARFSISYLGGSWDAMRGAEQGER